MREENIRYFKIETGGIVMLVNNVTVYSLNLAGTWVPNQFLISMFVYGMKDYREITAAEVEDIIIARKS